ncbi:MAG: hypothetical protein WDN09_01920 [bacterium]
MTWALRRQFLYVCILLAFFLALGFFVSYPYLHKAPSCFNFQKDGDETGIDCGGSCAKSCNAEVDPVAVLWARSFRVVGDRYNAVAYLENKNTNNAVGQVHYEFRFADKDNVYLGKRTGVTSVPPSGRFAVFEPAIDVGTGMPVYTTFQFTEEPTWVKVSQAKIDQLKIAVNGIDLEGETTSPRLTATITNDSLWRIPDISVVSILYNQKGDAVNASRTYVSALLPEGSADLSFTWPEPFPEHIVSEDILPMYNIFEVTFK